jgi:Flp pilus assembly protein TadG
MRKTISQAIRSFLRDEAGSPAVEFAMIAPVLLTLLAGIIQFGVGLNNYIELTAAVRSGGRNLAISRTSGASTPYTTTISTIEGSAPNLTTGSLSVSMTVNGTSCSTDSTCSAALNTAAGDTATVTASYPCNLTVMGVNFAPSCTLSAQTSDLVE